VCAFGGYGQVSHWVKATLRAEAKMPIKGEGTETDCRVGMGKHLYGECKHVTKFVAFLSFLASLSIARLLQLLNQPPSMTDDPPTTPPWP
jgi:hypothetical protein